MLGMMVVIRAAKRRCEQNSFASRIPRLSLALLSATNVFGPTELMVAHAVSTKAQGKASVRSGFMGWAILARVDWQA